MWFGHKSSEAVKELLEAEEFDLENLFEQETVVKDLRSEGELFSEQFMNIVNLDWQRTPMLFTISLIISSKFVIKMLKMKKAWNTIISEFRIYIDIPL